MSYTKLWLRQIKKKDKRLELIVKKRNLVKRLQSFWSTKFKAIKDLEHSDDKKEIT